MKKIKDLMNFHYTKSLLWLKNRESVEQTVSTSIWTFLAMVAAIVVFGGLLIGLVFFREEIVNFLKGVTTGTNTEAPGNWGQ